MVSFLQKTKPPLGCKFLLQFPQWCSSTLTHKREEAYHNDKWPPPPPPPTSHPARCPHCPAFWQHVSSSAANLQLGSQFHPEPKMPSSGNKLKSQLGPEKCKQEEKLGYTDVSWKPSKGKPISPSEHHGTLCRYLKSRHNTQLNYPGDPKDLTMHPETQIKVHLLDPSMYCSVLLEQSSNSGCIVLGDNGESAKNKVWKRNYKEKNWVGIIYSEEKSEYNFKCFQGS